MKDKKIHAECARRLKALGLHPNVLEDFESQERIHYSERTKLGGILYWMDNEPEWAEKVREVEARYNAVVYHATHEYTSAGEMLDLLAVFKDDGEEWWDEQLAEVESAMGHPKFMTDAVTWNISEDFLEEGSIIVRELGGGLVRTA